VISSARWPDHIRENEGSIGLLLPYHGQRRPQDNLDVEPQAPVIDVPEVELNAFLHQVDGGRFASQAVDLGPAGNARFDVMAEGIF
jgi:hypothetical protein